MGRGTLFAATALLTISGVLPAKADTGSIAATAVELLADHEIMQAIRGKEPVGPNGEVRRHLENGVKDVLKGPGKGNEVRKLKKSVKNKVNKVKTFVERTFGVKL